MNVLQPLAATLKDCPTLDTSINPDWLKEIWNTFRSIDLKEAKITPAILLGLIQYNEELSPLLTPEELHQLAGIACRALERYQQRIHPPKPVGLALAGAFKS